jgi:hypothetical protein
LPRSYRKKRGRERKSKESKEEKKEKVNFVFIEELAESEREKKCVPACDIYLHTRGN